MTANGATTYSPADPAGRWRPKSTGPECRYTFRDEVCTGKGSHYCPPRASRVVTFFSSILVHPMGAFKRQPFVLRDWQEFGIVRPLFGEVEWSGEYGCYTRRYRVAYIILGRKNGKALSLDTPILTGVGWSTMGELSLGDLVHSPGGSLVPVQAVSEVWTEPCYEVTFADGGMLTVNGSHEWTVNDRKRRKSRVIDTKELRDTVFCGSRLDHRYTVDVPAALDRPPADLPLDPYLLGAWLGDGTSSSAHITCHPDDLAIVAEIEAAGYTAKVYAIAGKSARTVHVGTDRSDGRCRRGHTPEERGVTHCRACERMTGKARRHGLPMPPQTHGESVQETLRKLGVLDNKHVPDAYLLGSQAQRLALLQGLMDTDGTVNVGWTTPAVEFTSTNFRLADAVGFLARSLGWKATIKESRATLYGRDCGSKWRVCWTAWSDRPPFRLDRKSSLLHAPKGRTRSHTNAICSVKPVEIVPTRCIQVEGGNFLAGRSLTPTHNSSLVAAIVLYLLVGDDEESSEVYGAAKDTKQAGKVFQPVNRMRQLSPRLNGDRGHSGRLQHNKNSRRVYDEQTASYYEVITSDAQGELGHNPHGFVLDEVLSQPNGALWEAMVTAQGARTQPMYLAVTTETNQPRSFGADLIDEAERVEEDPSRAPHAFAFVRKLPNDEHGLERLRRMYPGHSDLPVSVDPFDEDNWKWPNPALDEFLSRDALRQGALEAKNEPAKENGFRQFRMNQRVAQASRWMPMHLYDETSGDIWATPDWHRGEMKGRKAWFGFDLAAKFDLTAWCLMVPDGDAVDVLWRFWMPESALHFLDARSGGQWSRWATEGWVTVTGADVVDYDTIYDDVQADSEHFALAAGDCDQWSMAPVIQEIEKRTGVREIVAYNNTYQKMTPGMNDLMGMVLEGRFRHHGNPVARACFDSVEVRKAPYNPQLIRPDKPALDRADYRIDAVPAAAMAAMAMSREAEVEAPPAKMTVWRAR